MAGAAGRAEVVLAAGGAEADEAGHAVLHGLYWLVVNLAESGPLVLLVDDLHWADVPSLRFLEYLGRRLDGLAVTIVATTRPNEPGAPQALLDELARRARAAVLRPEPLDAEAVAHVLGRLDASPTPLHEAALGRPAATRCCSRCWPARPRRWGSTARPPRARAGGARGPRRRARRQRRLRPLGATALAVAHGRRDRRRARQLADVAALAGLEPEEARATRSRGSPRPACCSPDGARSCTPWCARRCSRPRRRRSARAARHRWRCGCASAAPASPWPAHWLQAEPAG